MNAKGISGTSRWAIGLSVVCLVLLGNGTAHAKPCTIVFPSPLAGAPPDVSFSNGEFYFRDGGTASFPLTTNPVGWTISQFQTLLGQASVSERIVRIHLTNGYRPEPTMAGDIDCDWAKFWDEVFWIAEQNGLYVLPVFDVWADWSTTPVGTQSWAYNIYNVTNGGPFTNPAELLIPGADQDLWLDWVEALVMRWQDRPNIVGWEVFSEINLISDTTKGAPEGKVTEVAAVPFAETAMARVRAADNHIRPVTVSQAGGLFSFFVNHWSTLATSSTDFIQIHPYAGTAQYNGNLDQLILDSVRELRTTYNKPVFIGESGLDTLLPSHPAISPTLSLNAAVGINQAIWAAAVSGSMQGRALWWEDGYDVFHVDANGVPLDLRTMYANASAPVNAYLTGVDYSGFEPLAVTPSADIIGAALGNSSAVLGWVRDVLSAAECDWTPANCNGSGLLTGQSVTVNAPLGQFPDWQVTFYDTNTGSPLQPAYITQSVNGEIPVDLPNFPGSIAFKIYPTPPMNVGIDIGPSDRRNRINLNGPFPLIVAILTTSIQDGEPVEFNAGDVDVSQVWFGPGGAVPIANTFMFDLGNDGDQDLLLAFRKIDTGLACGDTSATLSAYTFEGQPIIGTDRVRIVGCP